MKQPGSRYKTQVANTICMGSLFRRALIVSFKEIDGGANRYIDSRRYIVSRGKIQDVSNVIDFCTFFGARNLFFSADEMSMGVKISIISSNLPASGTEPGFSCRDATVIHIGG